MAFGEIVGGLSANWLLYASMPLVAALIGYLTKRAAIWMMFRPLEFRGVPPLLGWQGVIPRNSERIASTAMDALLSELLRPTDLIARLDPDALLHEAGPVMCKEVRRAVEQFVAEQHPAPLGSDAFTGPGRAGGEGAGADSGDDPFAAGRGGCRPGALRRPA